MGTVHNRRLLRIGWERYDRLIEILARKLRRKPQVRYGTIAGVPSGGLVPAVSLSHRLGGECVTADLGRQDVDIVVDDILDSGLTYRQVFGGKGHVKRAPVYFAVLCIKRSQLRRYSNTIHATVVEDDVWVVFPWEGKSGKRVRQDISAYLNKVKGE